jgi:hypothetical protein
VHDLSYHTSSIFLPPEMLEISRRQTRAILEFIDFARPRAPELFRAKGEQRSAILRLMLAQTDHIDDSGTITYYLANAKKGDGFHRAVLRFNGGGASPAEYLRNIAGDVEPEAEGPLHRAVEAYLGANQDEMSLFRAEPVDIEALCHQLEERRARIAARVERLLGAAH